MQERLVYDKPNRYNKKVLVGKWFEENSAFQKSRFKHVSTYSNDYVPKPYSANGSSVIWDAIFANEGTPMTSKIGSEDFPNLFDNFSSLYDLSYKHFPNWIGGPLLRKFRPRLEIYEPRDEYLNTFGNATKSGLLEYERETWRCEKSDPRTTLVSHYKDVFTPPDKNSYKFKRYGIPITNSSILYPNNVQNTDLKFRDTPTCTVPPNDKLVVIHPEPRCNPITWECPFKEKQRTRCIPQKATKHRGNLRKA